MRVYSAQQKKNSLLADEGISLSIPGGKGWYPFVMTFHDESGFADWCGEDAELTVLYNFPAYPHWYSRSSALYDPSSPRYNSFYGAYLVRREDGEPYGFSENGAADAGEIALVPEYDFRWLVLSDFGLTEDDWRFDWSVYEEEDNAEYLSIPGWTRLRAHLTVNGAYHEADGYARSYLQYGKPPTIEGETPFQPVAMEGLLYGRYFPECGISVFFYCVAAEKEIVEQTDRELLRHSVLKTAGFPG